MGVDAVAFGLNPLKSGEVPEQNGILELESYKRLNPLKSGEVPERIRLFQTS